MNCWKEKLLIATMLVIISPAAAAGQDLTPASKTLNRIIEVRKRLVEENKLPAEQLSAELAIVDEEVAKLIVDLLEVQSSREPWLVKWSEGVGPAVSGAFRYEVLPEVGKPVRVVPADLTKDKLSDLEFFNAMRFLAASHHVAKKIEDVPGPLHRGLIHLLVHAQTYPTTLSWSAQDVEAAALVYLLEAVDPRPLDVSFLHTGDQSKLRADVAARLGRLHTSLSNDARQALVSYVFEGPTNPPKNQIVPGEEEVETTKPVFSLAHVLSGGQADVLNRDERLPPASQQVIRGRVIAPLLASSERFRYLPARFLLLRTARALTAGRDVALLARDEAGLKSADGSTSVTRDQIDNLRSAGRQWFINETNLRLQALDLQDISDDETVSPVVTAADTLFDPRSMAEVVAFLVNDSVSFAKYVRVPFAESGGNMTRGELEAAVDQAFQDDGLLLEFFQRYGRPFREVRSAPGNESGKILFLRWHFTSEKGESLGSVEIPMADACSRGGSGLPIEPAILLTQQVMSARGIPSGKTSSRPLAAAVVGDYVQGLLPFKPAQDGPTDSPRWYQLNDVTSLTTDRLVEITAAGRSFAGTPSQRVFARPSTAKTWDWVPLSELRHWDLVWLVGDGPQPITGIQSRRGMQDFARLSIGGSDHVIADGFLARTREVQLPSTSLHGVVPPATTQAKPFKSSGDLTLQSLEELMSQVDWKERRFVEVKAIRALTTEPVAADDLLTNLQKNRTAVIFWISYLVDGEGERIGVAPSHAFLVKQERDLIATVAAHNLKVGDLLHRGGREEGLGFAEVTSVAVQSVGERDIIHPRLLSNKWMRIQKIIVHTDTEAFEPGLLRSTQIQLAEISVQSPGQTDGNVDVKGKVDVKGDVYVKGDTVPISEIHAFRPLDAEGGKGRLLRDASGHNLLAAYPAAPLDDSWVMSRTASRLSSTVVGNVYRIITQEGRVLFCSPGTTLWQETGDPESTERIRPVANVKAHLLKAGVRILALSKGDRQPRPSFQRVESVTRIDASKHKEDGVFEIFRVDLTESAVAFVQRHQSKYDTLFANGIAVNLAREVEQEDRFAGAGGGSGPGVTPGGPRGVSHGPVNDPVKLSENPFTRQMISFPAPHQPEDRLKFNPDDRKTLKKSLARLDAKMDEFRKKYKSSSLPAAGTAEHARLLRFLDECVGIDPATPVSDVCTSDNLFYSYGLYVDLRWDLIKRGRRQSLRALTHQGLRIAYPLEACGGPGKQLLEDLLTLHMRLALKKGGQVLWEEDDLWTRRLVQFAFEFDHLTHKTPTKRGLSAFRQTAVSPIGWIEVLQNRTAVDIHPDVITLTSGKDQVVRPYRLMLQLDEVTQRNNRVPEGLVFPGLDTEADDLFVKLGRYLELSQ